MSLNEKNYLRFTPSSVLVESRVAAKFHSASLQSQIDTINQRINSLCETVDVLNKGFEKLLDIYEREHGLTHDKDGIIIPLPSKVKAGQSDRYIQ